MAKCRAEMSIIRLMLGATLMDKLSYIELRERLRMTVLHCNRLSWSCFKKGWEWLV